MICTTTQVRTPPMDRHFSRNSNTAGAPLPLIPRRSLSSHAHIISSPLLSAPTTPCRGTKLQAHVNVQPPTPPETVVLPQKGHSTVENSDSSSSSLSSDFSRPTITRRSKRILGQRILAVCPPEFSTPTPAVLKAKANISKCRQDALRVEERPMDSDHNETPRPLYSVPPKNQPVSPLPHLAMPGLQTDLSTEAPECDSASIQIPPSVEARLIRKKSGQPVKSSLKSLKVPARGSLSVFTHGISSKSEPNTPTHAKAVHFDSQLEHVKLFLAEQKPLAVSRDGSPTDDTSGTDTDFPTFIFGGSDGPDEDTTGRDLVMEVTNMPLRINTDANVALEELRLSKGDACILGSVRVRNIAFQKWLAVRFTFDRWQTTSEVTAKYAESLDDGTFDRFVFTIRLNDMLSRIEGKTLVLALRYTVGGREIWDNNDDQNYLAYFTKVKSRPNLTGPSERDASTTNDIADLKSQLEKVVLGRDSRRRNALVLEEDKFPVFKEGTSLASRYDFATSLKSHWKPANHPSPPRHLRTNSYPSNHSAPSSIPWPPKTTWFKDRGVVVSPKPNDTLGSPRDLDEDRFRPATYNGSDSEELLFPTPSHVREGRSRQRGYFHQGLPESSDVKKTPAGTPLLTPTRFYSFPPVVKDRPSSLYHDMLTPTRLSSHLHFDGGSADSTPSIVSPSTSSCSTSPSPTEYFLMDHLGGDEVNDLSASPSDYHQFLNRFCFFTGNDTLLDTSTEAISRSHSVSSVEELLSSQSPRPGSLSQFATPTRNPSFDGIVSRSGSITPTARSFGTFESRSVTVVS